MSIVYGDGDAESTATPSKSELLNQELLSIINDLMQQDEDCQLPCFWGFASGKSSLTEIKDFWTTTIRLPIETTPSEDDITFASFWANFVPRNAYTDISFSMTFKDNILWLFEVSTFNTSIWLKDDWLSLQNVLSELPDSNQFFVGVSGGHVLLVLINQQANIMIQKSYKLHTDTNIISPNSFEPLLLCPTSDNLFDTSLWLLDKEVPISIEQILGNPIILGNELALYQPIEFMTNQNSDEFSDLIQDNPEACLDLLSYAELIELGYGF